MELGEFVHTGHTPSREPADRAVTVGARPLCTRAALALISTRDEGLTVLVADSMCGCKCKGRNGDGRGERHTGSHCFDAAPVAAAAELPSSSWQ